MTRILVYSHDTFGLGNIRRMLAIATHLAGAIDRAAVLIVSGSPMVQGFRIAPQIDYIKLPSVTRTTREGYTTRSLGLEPEDTFDLRANLILAAVADFKPDIILVDKKPFGVENELEGALHYAKASLPNTRVVLVLRDILDEPAATMRAWRAGNYSAAIERFYDAVLVLGSRAVFDACREYQFPIKLVAKTRFCGYIRREQGTRSRQAVRRALRVADTQRLVLVTTGGGQDGVRILENYTSALPLIHRASNIRSLIVTGPELDPADRVRIEQAASRYAGVEVREFTDDMMSLMAAADAVVCMGGYNTICEVASAERPAVVIPRVRPVEEQWIRAERLARIGVVAVLHPDDLRPETLADAVWATLRSGRRQPRRVVDLDALPRITGYISELTQASRSLSRRIDDGRLYAVPVVAARHALR